MIGAIRLPKNDFYSHAKNAAWEIGAASSFLLSLSQVHCAAGPALTMNIEEQAQKCPLKIINDHRIKNALEI